MRTQGVRLAHALRAVQDRQREIAALHQIAEIGLREQPLEAILPGVVQAISACTSFPIIAIEFYDPARQLMTFAAATGIPLPPEPDGFAVPVDQTLSGLVARSGEALIESQAQARSEYADAALRQLGVQTFVCVPMRIAGQVIGTLALAHPQPVPIDAQLMLLADSLATMTATLVARKRAEERSQSSERQLRESEHKLRTLVEILPVGVSILDTNRQISFVNPALEQMLDLSHDDLLRGTYLHRRYLRPDGTPMPFEEFASVRAINEHRAVHQVETGVVTESGQLIWTSVSAVPVSFSDWSVVIVTTDITMRKEAESALRTSQQNLETLIENTDALIWSIDPQYRLIVSNERFQHNLSVTLGHTLATGESLLTPVMPQAIRDEWQAAYDRAMQQGSFSLEVPARFTSEPRIMEYRFRPIITTTDQVAGVVVAGVDITAHKQIESALQIALTKYQTLFDSFPLGITVADATGQIVEANPMAERLLGLGEDEQRQRAIDGVEWRIVRPDGTPMPAEEYASIRALAEQRIVENVEMGVITPAGVTTWINVTAAPLPLDGYGVVITYSDITARRQAEAALHQALENLRRSNAELEQFAYVASHDLQEPLRGVTSMVQLLQQRYQGQLDARADQYIGLAVDAAIRMQALINDLLAFSRVQRRAQPFRPTLLEEVLAVALANLQVAIEESGALITHDPLPTLQADAGLLTQLLQNLIGNALKFHAEQPPRIHLSATRQEDAWCFAVRDNGIGIAPEYFERIFVIFQRLHARQAYSGTGIGLALCKKIVEHHGGQIWVESQPGAGATFSFTIPDRS